MKKKILLFILALLIFPVAKVYAEGEVDGDGQNAGLCSNCAWVYASTQKGIRLSLYEYTGSGTPKFIKAIELLNNPGSLNNKTIYAVPNPHGKYGHPNPDFKSTNTGDRFKSMDKYSFSNIDSSDSNWQKKLMDQLKAYYGDNQSKRKAALKKMFNVEADSLAKYYIVLEPTIAFESTCGYGYAFGTGYELMKNLSWLNSNGSCKTCDFECAQKTTVRDYIFNGMYVTLTADHKYDTNKFVGESDSGAYVIATSSETNWNKIKEDYTKNYFPHGVGIFWMLDGIKTCQSYCSGRSGDELLKCAENYCSTKDENVNSTEKKRECIVNDCKYTAPAFNCGNTGTSNGTDTVCADKTISNKKTCSKDSLNGVSYKIECNTTSTIVFPDTLPRTIIPGEGFEYQVKLYGNKTCTITLDTGKWKLDYASSYTDADREALVDALNSFNAKKFDNLSYSSENAGIKLEVKEARTNSSSVTTKTELVAQEKYNLGNKTVTQTNPPPTEIKSYYTIGETSYEVKVNVNTYTTDSSNEMLYDLKKVCISATDNITIIEGSTCDNGRGPYSKYFSSIFADKTDKNPTKTPVVHEISGLNVNNTCHFAVTPDELSCNISVNNQCSNYIDANNDVVFTLTASYNKNRSKNISYNIGTTKLNTAVPSQYNDRKTYTISKNSITTPKEVTIYGTVTDGTNIRHCHKTVKIFPNNNKCVFEQIENKIEGTVTLRIKDVAGTNVKYQIKDSTSNKWMDIQSKKIKKDESIIVEGRVIVNGVVKKDCYYEYPPTTTCQTCRDLYKPAQYEEIRNYCANNWSIDKEKYTSADNCYDHCTRKQCPEICNPDDYDCARNYCNESYLTDGYIKIGDCVNDCVNTNKNDGLNYYYRTISNDNPFPQREAHYNWVGYEEYITDDKDDLTPSVGGSYPEYEIKLDRERMITINDNTSNYNSSGKKSAYSDYIRVNKTDTGKYKSKFIHEDDPAEGGFKSYFTYIEGSKVGG